MLHPSKTNLMNFLDMLEKGNTQVVPNQKGEGFLSNLFLFEKKGEGNLQVINMIQLKKIHSLSSLQNGRFIFLKFMLQKDITCSSQIRRCILLNFIPKRLIKNDTLSVVVLRLQIYLPLFWLRSCNKNFYKDFGNSAVTFEMTKHKDYSIPERYSLIRKDSLRTPNGKGHCNLLNIAPRLCHKSEKISLNSNMENRIFGTDNRFSVFNIVTYPEKNTKRISSVMGDAQRHICFRTGKIVWSTFINSTSSFGTCSSCRFKF